MVVKLTKKQANEILGDTNKDDKGNVRRVSIRIHALGGVLLALSELRVNDARWVLNRAHETINRDSLIDSKRINNKKAGKYGKGDNDKQSVPTTDVL